MRTNSWTALLVLLATLAGGSVRAQEQELAFRASLSGTYSDNAARTATAPMAATALDGLIGLQLAHNSPTLYLDADFSELQRWYAQGHLPNETIPNGNLNLIARPIPDEFSWSVTDTIGQISSDPFAALFAGNRQNINVLSTGPDLRVALDSRDHVDISGRYGLDTFGDSTLNDQRYSGQVELAHDVGSGSQLGLVYAYQQAEFRKQTHPSEQIERAYAQCRASGARSYLVLEAGIDQLHQAASGRARVSHVLALLQRHLTDRLTFEGSYLHGYADTVQAFVSASRDSFTAGSDQTVQALAVPYEASTGYLMLTRSQGRLLASIEVTASHEDYSADPRFDRNTLGSNVAADYPLSSRLSLNLRAGYYETKFPNTQEDDRWVDGSIGVGRRFGRSLLLSLQVARLKGTSNIISGPIIENRAVLTLSYTPGAQQLARLYDPNAPFRFYDRPPPASQPPR